MKKIETGVEQALGWTAGSCYAVEWGKAVGVEPVDVSVVLPEDRSRAVEFASPGPSTAEESERAAWDLLLLDPTAELTVLAQDETAADPLLQPGTDPPDVLLDQSLHALKLPSEATEVSGFTDGEVKEAARLLAEDPSVGAAALAAGVDQEVLFGATARALVAILTVQAMAEGSPADELPRAAADAAARDELTVALIAAIAPDPSTARLIGAKFVKRRLLLPFATRVAVAKRAQLTSSFCDFARDVTFYLEHGEQIRDLIAEAILQRSGAKPLVLLGHSLGGIAAVDLLADPKQMSEQNALKVDLLVTVGSQAPLLYLMNSLSSLSPKQPNHNHPFTPWLNIYNPDDLLSFCAERVFPGRPHIFDREVDAGVPFPLSHSAYWDHAETFDLITQHLPE
jgi:hypothetical protein